MDLIERPFNDIIIGSIGIFSLLIIILIINTVTNAKISLNVDAPLKNEKYPLFVVCNQDKLDFICRNKYLPNDDLKNQLTGMCNSLKLSGIELADENQRWEIIHKFFSSDWFENDRFYIYALIRPEGIEIFNSLDRITRKNNIDVGYTPIAKDWDILEAIKVD